MRQIVNGEIFDTNVARVVYTQHRKGFRGIPMYEGDDGWVPALTETLYVQSGKYFFGTEEEYDDEECVERMKKEKAVKWLSKRDLNLAIKEFDLKLA